jgi:hypothetical protein
LSENEQKEELGEARSLLESVALLETVAVNREAKAKDLMESLVEDGMSPGEIAYKMDLSTESVGSILERDEPKPPHERAGISKMSMESLDPSDESAEAV